MACIVGVPFRIQSSGDKEIKTSSDQKNICTITKILERLHREFTEKYAPSTGTTPDGKTAINENHKDHPTFYLRKQHKLSSFDGNDDGQEINRFYDTLSAPKTEADQLYRSMIHSIMNGIYDENIGLDNFDKPAKNISSDELSSKANDFKGLYGLINLNKIIEKEIDDSIKSAPEMESERKIASDMAKQYDQRRGIQTTLETIASRENEIYREKFLNLFLIIVGIFLIGTQLVSKYFSFGSGGGASGSGGGGLFGNLFTGYGVGASSGIFSRFGGLGLGSSGRSRITGMFSNNPYSLSTK